MFKSQYIYNENFMQVHSEESCPLQMCLFYIDDARNRIKLLKPLRELWSLLTHCIIRGNTLPYEHYTFH